jgi:hypothetical protein
MYIYGFGGAAFLIVPFIIGTIEFGKLGKYLTIGDNLHLTFLKISPLILIYLSIIILIWLPKDGNLAEALSYKIKNPNWFKNYAIENKEKIAVKTKNWAKNNKGLVREKTRRYQATKLKATPPWLTAIHHAQIQEMYDVAVALEMQTGVPHHVDHIHPLQGKELCGLHVPWNLQVLPWRDNIAKSNKLIGEMR